MYTSVHWNIWTTKNNDILSKHQFYNISNIVLLNTNCWWTNFITSICIELYVMCLVVNYRLNAMLTSLRYAGLQGLPPFGLTKRDNSEFFKQKRQRRWASLIWFHVWIDKRIVTIATMHQVVIFCFCFIIFKYKIKETKIIFD